MSVFERYLTVWVFLCIVVGIALDQMLPGPVQAIGRMEIAKVNLPVGLQLHRRPDPAGRGALHGDGVLQLRIGVLAEPAAR